jgi:hypothetical protein
MLEKIVLSPGRINIIGEHMITMMAMLYCPLPLIKLICLLSEKTDTTSSY